MHNIEQVEQTIKLLRDNGYTETENALSNWVTFRGDNIRIVLTPATQWSEDNFHWILFADRTETFSRITLCPVFIVLNEYKFDDERKQFILDTLSELSKPEWVERSNNFETLADERKQP